MIMYKLMMVPVVLPITEKETPGKNKRTISSRNNSTCGNNNGASDDHLRVPNFTAPLYFSIHIYLDYLPIYSILLNFQFYLTWEKVQ